MIERLVGVDDCLVTVHKLSDKLLNRSQKSFYKNSIDGTFIFYSDHYGKWMKGGDRNGLEAVDCNTVPVCW